MVRAHYISHPLHFIRPAGTSRGVLREKPCWLVRIAREDGATGTGEVSFVPGLSPGTAEDLEIRLDHICKLINRGEMDPLQPLPGQPGIRFALETAWRDLQTGGKSLLYPSAFTRGDAGIPTNGLLWMGDRSYLEEQARSQVDRGFRVLKMKVGALAFQEELDILDRIRTEFAGTELEIRLDANGAWSAEEAPARLEQLVPFGIHSVEQPIAPGQPSAMADLCARSPVPIALDEELLGISGTEQRRELIRTIAPRYLVLKPGLLGGVQEAEEWIRLAGEADTGWWVTSALESNVGLNAIAQWTYRLGVQRPQGLGTGSLYRNNIHSPLRMRGDSLWYQPGEPWGIIGEDRS